MRGGVGLPTESIEYVALVCRPFDKSNRTVLAIGFIFKPLLMSLAFLGNETFTYLGSATQPHHSKGATCGSMRDNDHVFYAMLFLIDIQSVKQSLHSRSYIVSALPWKV